MNKRTVVELSALLLLIILTTLIGPAEKTLGSAARIVYLHGALVWVAIMTFGVAALLSLASLILRRSWLYAWSSVGGQVALLFWVGYLPISMWAAKVSWGRVFLDDPSFQRAFRIVSKPDRQPIQQLRVRRLAAHPSEIIGRITKSTAKMVMPHAVHDASPSERIVAMGQPLS